MWLASRSLLRSKRIQIVKFPILTRTNSQGSPTPYHPPKPFIQTLDPGKLLSKLQKIYNLSSAKAVYLIFRSIGGASSTRLRFHTRKENKITQNVPFPADTRGVFYYHVDPQLPPTSGGIRFRLCDSIETFDKGKDLHIAIGKPWDVPLPRIARNPDKFNEIARLLIEEGIVERDLVKDLRQLEPLGLPSRFVGLSLFHLSQPFIVDLESTGFTIHLVTRTTYSSMLFHSPFYSTHKVSCPYSGLVKVRFELSTLLEHKKKGPMMVLRIIEFLSPVQGVAPLVSGPHIEPETNSFLMRRTKSGIIKPWSYSLDRRSGGSKWKEFIAASSN